MATINGTTGDDLLIGTVLADTLRGFGGNDVLLGRDGNDLLEGGNGSDGIRGEAGNDLLDGGMGNDLLDGGSGIDTVTYARAQGGVDLNLQFGFATGAQGRDALVSIENVIGSNSGDLISASSADNRLVGIGGNDLLGGAGGNDTLDGGAGDDSLLGGAGNDELHGGTGDDYLVGGTGNDRVFGEDGSDYLSGDDGNDTLNGGAGFDVLNGGLGDDVLTGGADGDRFVFDFFDPSIAGHDRVTDFRHGEDVLEISIINQTVSQETIFDTLDSNNDGKVTGADAYSALVGGSPVIDLDALNVALGFAGGDASVTLTGVTQLVASDFGI